MMQEQSGVRTALLRSCMRAVMLLSTRVPLCAQCPQTTAHIDYPLNQSHQSGIVPVWISLTPLSSRWKYREAKVEIRGASPTNFLYENGTADITGSTTA